MMYNRYYKEIQLDFDWLDTDIATWDIEEHMYVPNINYVYERTGVDFNVKYPNNPTLARFKLIEFTRDVKNIQVSNMSKNNDRVMNEYLITTDKERGLAFVRATLAYIISDELTQSKDTYYGDGINEGIDRDNMNRASEVRAIMSLLMNGRLLDVNYVFTLADNVYHNGY